MYLLYKMAKFSKKKKDLIKVNVVNVHVNLKVGRMGNYNR